MRSIQNGCRLQTKAQIIFVCLKNNSNSLTGTCKWAEKTVVWVEGQNDEQTSLRIWIAAEEAASDGVALKLKYRGVKLGRAGSGAGDGRGLESEEWSGV